MRIAMQKWIEQILVCLVITWCGIKFVYGDSGAQAELLLDMGKNKYPSFLNYYPKNSQNIWLSHCKIRTTIIGGKNTSTHQYYNNHPQYLISCTTGEKEQINKYGYPLEIFSNIKTEDDYLLDVFRIPSGKSDLNSGSKPVVLLMHGLSGSARDYVMLGPERGLPFHLADKNYDVWMGNTRGTIYTRKHLILDPDVDPQFWEYSWHEIGVYDLPAIISLIKNVTKTEQFTYIGISQGATIFYVLTSVRPEYNKNINLMISLAPAVYMSHISGPLTKLLARFEPILTPLTKILGIYELPPQPISKLIDLATKTLCTVEGFLQDLCISIGFLISGYDPPQFNKSIIPVAVGERFAATRQYFHYAQCINSGEFRQFNFGRRENLERYGSITPPSYNLSSVVSPVAMFYGDGDWLVNSRDVVKLCKDLPNCVYNYKLPYKLFTHFDFVIANDVVKLVYENVFTLLDKFNGHV